jgi:hypothetical protein
MFSLVSVDARQQESDGEAAMNEVANGGSSRFFFAVL